MVATAPVMPVAAALEPVRAQRAILVTVGLGIVAIGLFGW
jgi:hypothetical protein